MGRAGGKIDCCVKRICSARLLASLPLTAGQDRAGLGQVLGSVQGQDDSEEITTAEEPGHRKPADVLSVLGSVQGQDREETTTAEEPGQVDRKPADAFRL